MNFNPPTTADYANHNAYEALQKNRSLEARVRELEREVAALKLQWTTVEGWVHDLRMGRR